MLCPLLLQPDNFTPAQRTPWGGRRIAGDIKARLGLPASATAQSVGESWELSLGPELPSRTVDGRLLADLVRTDPEGFLGAEAVRGGSALLLKWLDAADHLSVQIHPGNDDPRLAPDETGKPECWYIVARDQGAAIYLGLREGVTEPIMRRALESGADVSELLQRIPVQPGDFFALAAGTPHALGAGILLLEPQYVLPGKRGVTLRYWDWNRRYDAHGRVDPRGAARELHVERALEVTRWDLTGAAALERKHCSFGGAPLTAAARVEVLCGPEAEHAVRSPELRVARVSGHGTVGLPAWGTLTALTVIEGVVHLGGDFGRLSVAAGQTVAIPAALRGLSAAAEQAHALLCSAVA
jgi:mannose-6-phosphate isomerase class I